MYNTYIKLFGQQGCRSSRVMGLLWPYCSDQMQIKYLYCVTLTLLSLIAELSNFIYYLLLAQHLTQLISSPGAASGWLQLPALPVVDRCPVLSCLVPIHLYGSEGRRNSIIMLKQHHVIISRVQYFSTRKSIIHMKVAEMWKA